MKRLSKEQIKKRDELADQLTVASKKLEEAIEEFNEKVKELWTSVDTAMDEYNLAIKDADSFRDDVYSSISDHFDEKSEKWQEGDVGQRMSEWRDAWGEELEEIEIQEPDELDVPDIYDGQLLSDRPEEP